MTAQFQPAISTGAPLLAHLAGRFVSQRENLATEALAYILSRSENARAALARSLRQIGADIPDGLSFRTQAVSDDQAIPDLIGEDATGRQWLLMEAKFWAGLTSAQPVKYLQRLQPYGGGSLIFIVPALRAIPLWQELWRRCEEAGWSLREKTAPDGCRFAELGNFGASIGLVTWRELLTRILTAVEQAGEQAIASDVRQLEGLCNREDSEAFLPFESEELTSASIPRRFIQFCELVDDLTVRMTANGAGDTTDLRATYGKESYGRYLRIHGVACLLHFSPRMWASYYPSPIWLRIYGPDWKPDLAVIEQLNVVTLGEGRQMFRTAEGMNAPITLQVGVERDQVIQKAEEQLLALAASLKGLRNVGSGSSATGPMADGDQVNAAESRPN